MCKFKDLGVAWPPEGWKQLQDIDLSYGQAILKNPVSAIVTGMTYAVEPFPVRNDDQTRHYYYNVNIKGWDYNIYNESCEYSVLSFMLKDRPHSKAPKHYYMSNIKTQSQKLNLTERSAHRTFMAALFMMKQIASGRVPEVERILKLYKIHPAQRSLYYIDSERHDSLFCGLTEAELTISKKETAP